MKTLKSFLPFLCFISISICFLSNASAQKNNRMKQQNYKHSDVAERYKNELAPGEAAYRLVSYLNNKINDTPVHIFRYEPEPSTGVTLKGPHVTVILDDAGKLKGFARLTESMTTKNEIHEDEAIPIAQAFLKKYAPDLADAKYQWTDTTVEKVVGKDGKERNVTGTWVKYRDRQTGEYLWVILAPDKSVREFDRDIVWNFFRGGRVNELWLRDEWFGKWLAKRK